MALVLIETLWKLADNLDRQKISNDFVFPARLGCWPWSHLPLSAENLPIRPCPEHRLFSFDWIFMKVADSLDRHKILETLWKFADNQDRQKISNDFDFPARSDNPLCSYLPLSAKKPTLDFVRSIAWVQSLWKINRTGINYSTSWKLGHIALFTLELHAFDWIYSFISVHYLLWSYMPLIGFIPSSVYIIYFGVTCLWLDLFLHQCTKWLIVTRKWCMTLLCDVKNTKLNDVKNAKLNNVSYRHYDEMAKVHNMMNTFNWINDTNCNYKNFTSRNNVQ